jgi:hypothetical protein
MPIFLLFISLALMASEVTTLNLTRNKTELLLMTTDESLTASLDKTLLISPCKPRQNLIGAVLRENYISTNCRAEVIKIIINAGFKPLDARTFIK